MSNQVRNERKSCLPMCAKFNCIKYKHCFEAVFHVSFVKKQHPLKCYTLMVGPFMVLFVAGYKVTKNNSQTPIAQRWKRKTIEYKSTLFVPSLLHTVSVYLFLLQLAILEVWCVLKRNYDARTTVWLRLPLDQPHMNIDKSSWAPASTWSYFITDICLSEVQ